MVLEVSSTYAVYPAVIKLTFTGAIEEFSTEIQIQRLRGKSNNITSFIIRYWSYYNNNLDILDELDLQALGRQGGNDNFGPANMQPLHFNGFVQPF